jgi:gluconate 2-dehydrogenase gamma chain
MRLAPGVPLAVGDSSDTISRRKLLALGGSALGFAAGQAAARAADLHDGMLGAPVETITGKLPWHDGDADAPSPAGEGPLQFFSSAESAFVTAAADRLIPPDGTGPSASEAGVPFFLDRELAGRYGQGDHFFLGGPWSDGAKTQGYQSRLTPAQFYRQAITEIEAHVAATNPGKTFKDLAAGDQDALLKQMESGDLKLNGNVKSDAFFTMFLQNVKEGYFSDPIYGGNKNGAAWKMIGFPGAHYDYSPWVSRHNEPVPVETVGLRGRPGWARS